MKFPRLSLPQKSCPAAPPPPVDPSADVSVFACIVVIQILLAVLAFLSRKLRRAAEVIAELRIRSEQRRSKKPQPVERAMGDNGRGVHGMNVALYKLGALRHEPPAFSYFDPVVHEKCTLAMKELRLPTATETHELVFEPRTRCLFVSQMSNSVLVRIPLGADGMLLDDQVRMDLTRPDSTCLDPT
jgi:hypothetical protein